MANRAKFCRLFDDGDILDYQGDHSVADQGLCRLIAFRTQDPEQIDRIFRLSALNRAKWESRQDYRDRTIAKAITHVKDRYRGISADHDGADDEYHGAAHGDIRDGEQEAQEEAEQEIHDDEKYKPIEPYLIKWSRAKGTALYYRKPGTTDDQILANFMAWIVEERLEDDGAEPVRMVTMDATLISGKRFPEIRMAVPEFYNLAGILKALGTEAVVSPGPMVKDRTRHAIQLFSNRQKYPQRHVFTHLGWRQVDGVWCYLHAGGSIPGKAEVSVDKALQRYVLPPVVSAHEAMKASLRTLECAPQRLTLPLVSMVYLAPLAHWLDADVSLWVEGPSGAHKSSLAALMMSHFGPFSRAHPPESWESTANALERLSFLAKDTVLWIDDYAPQPSAKEAHDQERKAQRVIRAQGNLSGRGRMRADMSLRPQYYPSGVILSTGELHPTGTSTFARLLQLDVAKEDINLKSLTVSQAESHLLAEAMAAYIGWLQPQLDTLPAVLKSRWTELRAEALPQLTHHSRHPEVYAHLATAWELFLRFATEQAVLTEQERQEHWFIGRDTLMLAINRQRLDAEAEDPVHRFCSHLKEAFIQGKAYLDDVNGGYPTDAGQWGWTMQSFPHHDGTSNAEWKPSTGASMLGWIDQDFLYLLPDAAYRLVFENLQRAGVTLLPQQTMWKRLVDRGYVQRGETRYTTRKRLGTDRPYVLKMVRRYVEDYLSPQSGDSGDNGDNVP
jgi:NrS-1  polymerase HBD domain